MFDRLLMAHSRRGVTIHDLRRTAGARKYRATGDIALVSNFLGHANSLITERHYVHIRLDDLQARILTAEAPYEEKERQVREQLAA